MEFKLFGGRPRGIKEDVQHFIHIFANVSGDLTSKKFQS